MSKPAKAHLVPHLPTRRAQVGPVVGASFRAKQNSQALARDLGLARTLIRMLEPTVTEDFRPMPEQRGGVMSRRDIRGLPFRPKEPIANDLEERFSRGRNARIPITNVLLSLNVALLLVLTIAVVQMKRGDAPRATFAAGAEANRSDTGPRLSSLPPDERESSEAYDALWDFILNPNLTKKATHLAARERDQNATLQWVLDGLSPYVEVVDLDPLEAGRAVFPRVATNLR